MSRPVSAIIMKLLARLPRNATRQASGLESDLRRCLAAWETQRRVDEFPLAKKRHARRLLISEKLYGRAREIDTLLASFHHVVATGTPELVLVSDMPVSEKSSVVNELHKVLVPPAAFLHREVRPVQTRHPLYHFGAGLSEPCPSAF